VKNPEKHEFDHRLPSGKVEIPLIKRGLIREVRREDIYGVYMVVR
jgi:hypothetical protein